MRSRLRSLAVLLAIAPLGARAAPRAEAWPLLGDATCAYGEADCNRCIEDVVGAVRALRARPTARVRYRSMANERLPPFGERLAAFGSSASHLQGIGRIASAREDDWLVVSRARPGRVGGGGFFLVELGDLPGRGGATFGTPDVPLDAGRLAPSLRRTAYYYPVAGVDHPGGMQMLGTTLALASSCAEAPGCDGRAFVELHDLRVPGARGTLVTRMPLFRRGEPHARRHASAVAIARLTGGRHLMYVHGKDDRREGWLYRSDAPGLSRDTHWSYVEHLGGVTDFDGGYQNVAMLTECRSGGLYLLATGNARYGAPIAARTPIAFARGFVDLLAEGRASRGRETLDLFRLERVADGVRTTRVHSARFVPDRRGYCSFRAGTGIHVTPDGRLALYCTTYKANTDLLGVPDGKLKLLELSGASK